MKLPKTHVDLRNIMGSKVLGLPLPLVMLAGGAVGFWYWRRTHPSGGSSAAGGTAGAAGIEGGAGPSDAGAASDGGGGGGGGELFAPSDMGANPSDQTGGVYGAAPSSTFGDIFGGPPPSGPAQPSGFVLTKVIRTVFRPRPKARAGRKPWLPPRRRPIRIQVRTLNTYPRYGGFPFGGQRPYYGGRTPPIIARPGTFTMSGAKVAPKRIRRKTAINMKAGNR